VLKQTPCGEACLSIRMTDILLARTVRLSCCLSGKKYLPGMRCPSVVRMYLRENKHQTARDVRYESCWSEDDPTCCSVRTDLPCRLQAIC